MVRQSTSDHNGHEYSLKGDKASGVGEVVVVDGRREEFRAILAGEKAAFVGLA